MKSFRYLRHLITTAEDDWPYVIRNLQKAKRGWDQLSLIFFGRKGIDEKENLYAITAVTS